MSAKKIHTSPFTYLLTNIIDIYYIICIVFFMYLCIFLRICGLLQNIK